MTKTMNKSFIAMLVMAPLMAACPAGIPGTTPGQGSVKVTGNVVKGSTPFGLATVRIIEQVGGVNREVRQTDNQGNYQFENIPAGTYRVAFDRANLAEVKDKAVVYQQNGSDTYGFFSTTEFTLTSTQGIYNVPALNVSWSPNLNPSPDGSAKAPVTFTWASAPGATSYSVRITNGSDTTEVVKSGTLQGSATSYTWDGKNSKGVDVAPGQYAWSVNVNTPSGFGGTNLSKFNLQ